jgi:serralysin
MAGGAGDDVFQVDDVHDLVFDAVNGGSDEIYTSVDFRLHAGQEIETLVNVAYWTVVKTAGNEFANRIIGATGTDKIHGGGGDDVIIGGWGADILFGDSGADRFVFNEVWDSGPGVAARDRMMDFTPGEDKIDLSAIDANLTNGTGAGFDDAFTFVGSGPLRHAGDLRAYEAGANTIVAVDLDGNHTPDLQILLAGHLALSATDFVL